MVKPSSRIGWLLERERCQILDWRRRWAIEAFGSDSERREFKSSNSGYRLSWYWKVGPVQWTIQEVSRNVSSAERLRLFQMSARRFFKRRWRLSYDEKSDALIWLRDVLKGVQIECGEEWTLFADHQLFLPRPLSALPCFPLICTHSSNSPSTSLFQAHRRTWCKGPCHGFDVSFRWRSQVSCFGNCQQTRIW